MLAGGLFVAVLDGAAAVLRFLAGGGKDPTRVFVFIASGAFGRPAFAGDPWMPLWGALFHTSIATAWTAVYVLGLAPRLPRPASRWPIAGALYGVLVWALMSQVVVPLSRAPEISWDLGRAAVAVAIHIVCVGLPIAWIARRRGRSHVTAGPRSPAP